MTKHLNKRLLVLFLLLCIAVAFGLIKGAVQINFSEIFLKDNRVDRKSTRLNSSHLKLSRMPSSA